MADDGASRPEDADLAQGSRWASRAPSPELHLAGFDGPMDLLLDLALRQRIDLGRISILALAEQFVAAFERLDRHVPLERRADWLVMATRLLLLRAGMLGRSGPEAAELAPEAAREAGCVEALLLAREAADWLDRRTQLGRDVFARPPPLDENGPNPRAVSHMALMEACLAVLQWEEERSAEDEQPDLAAPGDRPARVAPFPPREAMARIRALLAGQGEVDFVRCLPAMRADDPHRGLKARFVVASHLVAVLELARIGEVAATQPEPLAPILLAAAGA